MCFLISGLGLLGHGHLMNLVALGQTDSVLHRTEKGTLPDDELAGYPIENDILQALGRWSPDTVIVSNPSAFRLDVAIPVAIADCSILLEKLISHTLDRVDVLQVAIEMSGGKILIGFQFRVHPRIRHIVKLLNEGEIGTPTSAKSHWGEFLPGGHPCEEYRASYSARGDLGGGVLVTLDYPFDYLRWLFGEICTESIIAGKYGEPDFAVEVAAAVIPSIRDKLICLLDLDYNQQPPSHWFRLSRIQGSIR